MLKAALILLLLFNNTIQNDEYCPAERTICGTVRPKPRYVFYDVHPLEGFNLRRDVYMRFALWTRHLDQSDDESFDNIKLVLPPWSRMYHWSHSDEPEFIPWSYYFDLESMQKFAPVIPIYQFFDEIGVKYSKIHLDEVFILQNYKELSGQLIEKMSIEKCIEPITPDYFHYSNITSNNIKCLSFHGAVSQLTDILDNSPSRTFLFLHGEIALYDFFGDKTYWQCRRSMRFNKDLVKLANDFRRQHLESVDSKDNTELPDDWRKEKPKRNAKGGPYLAVHLRQREFVIIRSDKTPSIINAAKQIKSKLTELGLKDVFVATDAGNEEVNQLKSLLDSDDITVHLYIPYKNTYYKYGDGGIAIIEQIICSYARYFIGTSVSTFTFRIQEEREIIGFPINTTFNNFCGDKEPDCKPPSILKITY